jgi:hypothetical protein
MEPQGELFQIVAALGTACRLAGRLDGRQKQRDQDANDGDHDQEFDQRKTAALPGTPER